MLCVYNYVYLIESFCHQYVICAWFELIVNNRYNCVHLHIMYRLFEAAAAGYVHVA